MPTISKIGREALNEAPKYKPNSDRQNEYDQYVLDLFKTGEVYKMVPDTSIKGETTRALTLRLHASLKRLRVTGVIPADRELRTVTIGDEVRAGFLIPNAPAEAAKK